MAGMVTGAAVMGKKPIMEVQFADFSTIAFNQIVNMAATHYYRTGIPANITVRLPCGNPRHRPFPQPEPGSLVRPLSGPARHDSGHGSGCLLDAAPGRGNSGPRHFLEHKFLYRWLKAEDNYREAPVIPFGTADRPHGEACHRGGVQRHGAGSRACGRPA